ncbi:cyclophilin-like fold protein [Algoriphagus aquimarinus]|uniref:Cyclophilin-like domain-containing protein n=1 Tax=Algoriphagus aquimarinus TaxID=237018 RepID=A0A5C7AB33_9BACT|nr:cyclophilin-like fold protein [Algoriphagus aquimarinus]TXE02263.1 hypothetical protein ESV85_21540 [Algoriphagus aquimarinus]
MKSALIMILMCTSVVLGSASSCIKEVEPMNSINNSTMENGKIKITVNSQSFTATLLDNDSAKAFMIMLPMTIHMTELNGNEKYDDLSNSLPTNSSNPGTIKNGDLMLYGSKTLVLFYKTFSTAYNYTKLGTLDDATGLASALGSRNVTVTFAVE